jgi:two-component system alkaline phosphatase synthesis response regulator PhoP
MKLKVLVVDDEPEFIELFTYNLANEGFDIFRAGNGMEALHQARRVLPDVVLLDLMLPDIDGFSVCEILRAQPSTADVPIIVVSALASPSACGRSIETQVVCHFKKPVDFKTLGNAIHTTCAKKRREQAETSDTGEARFN